MNISSEGAVATANSREADAQMAATSDLLFRRDAQLASHLAKLCARHQRKREVGAAMET